MVELVCDEHSIEKVLIHVVVRIGEVTHHSRRVIHAVFRKYFDTRGAS